MEEQKRRIGRMLNEEKKDREQARLGHEEELNAIATGNQKISEDLKDLLNTWSEVEQKPDDE